MDAEEFRRILWAHALHTAGRQGGRRADLRLQDLANWQLDGLELRDALITGCRLRNASLTNADLSGTDFYGTDLSGADLRHAVLRGARFERVRLDGARLDGADLDDAVFHNCRLDPALRRRLQPPSRARIEDLPAMRSVRRNGVVLTVVGGRAAAAVVT
jgi:uncharacterized protein YjbI with pentapeptide repeats